MSDHESECDTDDLLPDISVQLGAPNQESPTYTMDAGHTMYLNLSDSRVTAEQPTNSAQQTENCDQIDIWTAAATEHVAHVNENTAG